MIEYHKEVDFLFIEQIANKYYRIKKCTRKKELFFNFLPEGLRCTTLSCVLANQYNELFKNKFKLAILVVIYDDLVDNPLHRDPNLFNLLCKLPFESSRITNNSDIVIFAKELWKDIFNFLNRFKDSNYLIELYKFDIHQLLIGLRYSQLLLKLPHISNPLESAIYQSHNMAMILFDMMDLISCNGNVNKEEFPLIREAMYMRQRMGRISNCLFTLSRELNEDDVTNDIYIYAIRNSLAITCDSNDVAEIKKHYELEWSVLYKKILSYENKIKFVNIRDFLDGINSLHSLHAKFEGKI